MTGGVTVLGRPVHIAFPVFTLDCGTEEVANLLLGAMLKHRTAVRHQLGLNHKHHRKIGQRGDGMVLRPEARNHYETVPSSPQAVNRVVVSSIVALLSLFALWR